MRNILKEGTAFPKLSLFGPGVLRLFLAWLVVVHHSSSLALGGWAVYVFFTLSGYWISVMWNTKYRRCDSPYLVFIISRYWRLLPIFVICSALGVWACYLFPQIWAGDLAGSFNLQWWLRTFLVAGCSRQPLFLGPAWSLDVEMEFYFIAPFLVAGGIFSWCSPKKRVVILCLMFISLCLLWGFFGIKTAKYFSFFLAGVITYATDWRPSRRLATISASAMLAIVLISAWLPSLHPVFWQIPDAPRLLLTVRDWVSIVAALAFLPFSMHTVSQPSSSLDRSFGDLAYSTYTLHWIPVILIRDAFPQLPQPTLISWICTLVGSVCLYRFADRPFERLRRAFVKSRMKNPPCAEEKIQRGLLTGATKDGVS